MITSISSSNVTVPKTTQAQHAAQTAKPPANPPQDKVQLSSQALSAGDVDHDGDSH
jgi:hypothetical protein